MYRKEQGSIEPVVNNGDVVFASDTVADSYGWRRHDHPLANSIPVVDRNWKRQGRRLVVASAMLSGSLGLLGASQAAAMDDPTPDMRDGPCEDTDGDGWGWDGKQSCRMDAVPVDNSPETQTSEDSIPQTWETNDSTPQTWETNDSTPQTWETNDSTPQTWETNDSTPEAIIRDGVGDLLEEYIEQNPPSPVCVDTDGDGWGWDGEESCEINRPESSLKPLVVDPGFLRPTQWTPPHCHPSYLVAEFCEQSSDGDAEANGDTSVEPPILLPDLGFDIEKPSIDESWNLSCPSGTVWTGATTLSLPPQPICGKKDEKPPICKDAEDHDGDGWGWDGEQSCLTEKPSISYLFEGLKLDPVPYMDDLFPEEVWQPDMPEADSDTSHVPSLADRYRPGVPELEAGPDEVLLCGGSFRNLCEQEIVKKSDLIGLTVSEARARGFSIRVLDRPITLDLVSSRINVRVGPQGKIISVDGVY